MAENNDKLVPAKQGEANASGLTKSQTGGVKVGLPKLQRAVAAAEEKQAKMDFDAQTMPNRLVLMLDDSGSMSGDANGKPKIEHLKDAVTGFLNSCNWRDTAVALYGFNQTVKTPLDTRQHLLIMQVLSMDCPGGTPIRATLETCLMQYAMTRGVIISDGSSTDGEPEEECKQYREAGVPVDAVHIGNERIGEATMQRIAELTGGIFIKFDNVAAFARSLKYLSPAMYGMLTSGQVSAEELGAKEIK